MADLKRTGLNNQKRGVSVAVTEQITYAAAATPSDTVFTLPANSMVTGVYAIVTDAAGAGDTLDVVVGATVVANEIAISALGVASGTVAVTNFPTGGAVTVVAGAGAALGDASTYQVVVEYIELDKVTGEYTN